jgi:hypothetical protein
VQATCRYFFFADFGPGPTLTGVSSPCTTRARMISDRMALFAGRDCLRGAGQQGVHPAVRGPGPRHGFQDVRAPFDGDVVHDHKEHAPGLEVQPVGDGAGLPGLQWGVRDIDLPARAFHRMRVVLGGLRPSTRAGR